MNQIELYYADDYSLAEIAEEFNISRQAVYDNIKRTEKVLESYEEKLHLFSNYVVRNQLLEELMKKYPSDQSLISKLQEIQQIDEEEFQQLEIMNLLTEMLKYAIIKLQGS